MTRRALVTGSGGLIGRYMVNRLRADDWDIHQIDLQILPGIDAREFLRRNTTRYDLAVHCAAHVGGRTDIEGKPTYLGAYNLQLDGAFFEWALRTHPAHLIYWSSSAAYPIRLQRNRSTVFGEPRLLRETDINLADPDLPDETYGWVKLTGERLAAEAQQEGLRIHVFRPFSGWAADQDSAYPMRAFLDRARQRDDPFEIWGDGTQTRDFIHIGDVVAGALVAVEQDYPDPLNLCTGVGTSFNDLATLLCKSVGYTPQIQHHLDRPTGVQYRVGDPTEMMKVHSPRWTLQERIAAVLATD